MLTMMIAAIESDPKREFMANLYVSFYGKMKKKAMTFVSDEHTAEEIMQETFIKLIENVDTVMNIEKTKLPAYVYVAVRNTAFDYLRNKKRDKDFLLLSDFDDEESFAESNVSEPETLFLQKENIRTLAKVLEKLPERDRIILESKYILGMKDSSLAKRFGISESGIRMCITRAKRKAYKLMEGEMAHE
ncbi:MAG: sigma-70 family RNA polymerase sigma factor [Oscillospiraceae bacterium]|nr:sigma-70 family RNA polymerase sigma factor [Oscillospiraceae bacterium]